MRQIILDSRPKWRRRLGQYPLHMQAWILLTSTAIWAKEIALFTPESRDSWKTIVEEC